MTQPESRCVAAVVAIVCSAVVTAVHYVDALEHFGDVAAANSALSYSDREIAGGNSIVVDQEVAYEARALIPRSGTFRVVTGDKLKNATPLTFAFVDGWFRSFLLPRRIAGDARWIVCYGCNPSRLGGAYVVRWHDSNNISIGVVEG